MSFLNLNLAADLMSFGKPNNWMDYRETEYHPTKSAIIGMIAAALGIKRGEERLNDLSCALTLYMENPKEDDFFSHSIILEDFQIVRPLKSLSLRELVQNDWSIPNGRFQTANGNTKNTLPVMHKFYLQDTSFHLVIEGEDDLIEEIANALDHPVYPLYIGRKCCIPSCRIRGDIVSEIEKNNYSVLK